MKWYFALVDSIVRAAWRRRSIAAIIVALCIFTLAPLLFGPDDESWYPMRYILSAEQPGQLKALTIFDRSVTLPALATPLITLLAGLGIALSMIAILRILMRRHWAWFPVVFLWPLAVFYFIFGPDDK